MAEGGKMTIDLEYQQVKKTDIKEEIETAIEKNQYFYVGVAKRDETALEAVYKREGRRRNRNGEWSQANHHADRKAAGKDNVRRATVFYTLSLIAQNACDLQSELIDEYRNLKKSVFCLNGKSGEGKCFKDKETEEGIVYLRVYKR